MESVTWNQRALFYRPLTSYFPGNAAVPFVIPSVPGFPTSPLSLTTTYVVLSKENHT